MDRDKPTKTVKTPDRSSLNEEGIYFNRDENPRRERAAYNEETSIGSVVLRSKKYADKVVVVDDGSTDKGG
jgi:hypothetical protein